jgi:hypothetical protein
MADARSVGLRARGFLMNTGIAWRSEDMDESRRA